MKDRDKLIIAIGAVLLIIVVAVGGTFAFWSWTSSTAQQTNVQFVVSGDTLEGQLYANLDGGGATPFTNLAPVSSCTNSTYAMKKELTLNYANETTNAAHIYATLSLSDFTTKHGTPSPEALAHLHYAVTTGEASSCTDNVVSGMSGVFTSTADGALFTNVDLLGNAIAAGTTRQEKTFYLWVWMDSGYTTLNTGSEITDPMQDISFNLTWSGTITNENVVTG